MIYFSFWNICFAHHNFKMVDQCFHVIVNFFFWRKIKFRNIGMNKLPSGIFFNGLLE